MLREGGKQEVHHTLNSGAVGGAKAVMRGK